MAQPWRDIDNPGVWRKPEPETPTKPATGFDDSPPAPREPLAKEYRFKDVSIVEPAQGFEKNKPFDMEGEIEPFDKSKPISASKILLYPIGIYNGQEDNFVPGGIEADLDQKTGKFRATCKSLFDPQPFANDTNKPADATWKLYVRAEGGAAEKPMESDQLTFPKESQFVELKKGDYDEDGAKTYGKPESGENFKSNGVVKSLQGDLIKTLFLPKGSGDGFFGDQTDKAVKEFQGYAIKAERMKRSAGKTEKTNQTLDVPQPNGVVEKKTRDELDRWLQSDWVKPIPTLRHGEYDDTGVSNGKGKRGTDDHHEGTPVVDAQKDLQKVGVYVDCALDGWFYDKMLDAVKQFQEAAVKGEFLINGALTDIGEKLSGHSKGELCLKTQEFLKKVAEKGGKVPGKNDDSILNQKYATIMKGLAGKPYILDADGPDSFDCSGAACWGLRKTANPNFGDYTADDLFRKFTKVSESTEPGTVKFYDYTSDGKIDHVTSIIDNSQMVHPSSGAGVIEIRPINYLDSYTKQKGGIIYNRGWNWDAIKK
jgi:hypothetical protein